MNIANGRSDPDDDNGGSPIGEQKYRAAPRTMIGATVRVILGIVFFVLGVVGALLPIVQGWVFFALSLLMFFPNHPRVDGFMRRAEKRTPRTVRWLRRLGFGVDDLEGISRIDLGELVHRHPHDHHRTDEPS